jgi:hypothetical protein
MRRDTNKMGDLKFKEEDLPKILTALQDARFRKETCSVTIHFAADGGVISVVLEGKKKYK